MTREPYGPDPARVREAGRDWIARHLDTFATDAAVDFQICIPSYPPHQACRLPQADRKIQWWRMSWLSILVILALVITISHPGEDNQVIACWWRNSPPAVPEIFPVDAITLAQSHGANASTLLASSIFANGPHLRHRIEQLHLSLDDVHHKAQSATHQLLHHAICSISVLSNHYGHICPYFIQAERSISTSRNMYLEVGNAVTQAQIWVDEVINQTLGQKDAIGHEHSTLRALLREDFVSAGDKARLDKHFKEQRATDLQRAANFLVRVQQHIEAIRGILVGTSTAAEIIASRLAEVSQAMDAARNSVGGRLERLCGSSALVGVEKTLLDTFPEGFKALYRGVVPSIRSRVHQSLLYRFESVRLIYTHTAFLTESKLLGMITGLHWWTKLGLVRTAEQLQWWTKSHVVTEKDGRWEVEGKTFSH